MQAPSRNRYCSGKAVSVTYSGCVFVALVIQHAMRHVVICGLSSSTIFGEGGGGVYGRQNVFFYFSFKVCLKYFLFEEELSEILP